MSLPNQIGYYDDWDNIFGLGITNKKLGIWEYYWGVGCGIRIGDWNLGSELRIRIENLGLEFGI